MAGDKSCRHVRQAVHLTDFRRALKKQPLLACEICSAPSASRNHRGSPRTLPLRPEALAPSAAAAGTLTPRRLPMSPISPDAAALPPTGASPRAALQSWEGHEQWTDLCICVACGFIGCFSSGHFGMHFQMNPKHFVGLQVASKTFWCTPCKMDIPENARPKVENARAEFRDALEEIATKKRRQLRSQMRITVPTTSSSASPTSTPNGSARSLAMDLDAHADTPPVPRGALTLDTKRVVDIDIDDVGPDAGTGSQRGNGSLAGTTNGVAPLLSMPLRTKARDEKLRRRLLKTAMQKRGEPVKQQELAGTAVVTTKETSDNGSASREGMPCSVLGFTNLGNTCYFNAPMQALLTATHYFPEHTHIEEMLETSNAPIATTFTMLHETVKKRARRALTGGSSSSSSSASDKSGKNGKSSRSRSGSSSVLTVAPLLKEMRKKFTQFRGHYQQDAHELFTSFLWAIDEEMDPPLPAAEDEEEPPRADTEASNGRSVTSSNGSTANSSEEVELTSSRQESWPEEDATDDSEATDADAELEAEGEASGESETEGEEQETKQIFVKTETGETISMQVPQDATVKEVQHLLAKRLNLNEEDMMLDASKVETRATLSSRPSAVLHARAQRKTYSKLNFTRSLFGGALTTAVTCQACGKRTEIVEDAFHLSVSVPESSSHRVLSTIDCLTNFVSETKLLVEAKNGYDCEKCSRQPKVRSAAGRFMRKKRLGSEAETELILRDAAMKLYVSALPRVLVVHLKRLARSRKLTQHIAFEERLDMTPFVSDVLRQGGGEARHHSLSYELIAVVVHIGNKRSGHYVAYVSRSKRREALLAARARSRQASEESATSPEPPTPTKGSEGVGRAWFYVSDTVVKRVALEQVLQCEAYMLFYQRRAKESSRATPAASPTAKTLTEATL